MALQDILEKITKDAEKTIAEIEKEADREIDRVETHIQDRVSKLQENERKQTDLLTQAQYRSRLASYRQKIKYRLDEQKRALLDEAFERALSSLEDLQGEDRYTFLQKYVQKLKLPKDEYVIYGNEKDVEVTIKILEECTDGCIFHKKIEKEASGGCRIETSAVSYDLRFSRILSERRVALEAETAQQLFG